MPEVHYEIDLPVDARTLWDFHIDPSNAAKIAPPFPKVVVLDAKPFSGLGDTFRFQLVIAGLIRITWHGEITKWNPPTSFTDVQRSGPFAQFEHTHTIETHGDGSRLTDHVVYRMKGGPFAGLVDAIAGRRQLDSMFAYRHRVLRELFGAG